MLPNYAKIFHKNSYSIWMEWSLDHLCLCVNVNREAMYYDDL